MRIPPVNLNLPTQPLVSVKEVASPDLQSGVGEVGGDPSATFTQAIKKAVGEVNSLQGQADKMAVNLASGDVEDVHKAMMAMQKAKLALDFTIQVRNKVIDAYQEIMRMQV